MKSITDAVFEQEVLKSSKPVVVDFWAEWCGPCRMLTPIVEELSESMGDKVVITKMNVDENPETPAQYGIRGIPTLIMFKNGEVVDSKSGMMTKSVLEEWINSAI